MTEAAHPPIFTSEEERLAIHQLSGNDHVVQKVLQEVERNLRNGRVPADARPLRTAVIACLSRESLLVKRWAINVLVELGADDSFEDELNDLVPHCAADPDLLASVVRLLFSDMKEVVAFEFMRRADFSIEGLVLIAGSEFSRKLKKRLGDEMIPLENASSDELRAGIVLTGRGKAPENLFLKNHPNAVALSELNLHDNAGVVKYALWGMAELNIGHDKLKIPLHELDSCEEQIKKWVYRLVFASEAGLSSNLDLLPHIMREDSSKVREEGAIGLRGNFVAEAVPHLLKWYTSEQADPVRNALIDHFANSIERDIRYIELIEQLYHADSHRGLVRERIEAGVKGTEYYSKFRAYEIRQESITFLGPFESGSVFGMSKVEQTFNNPTIGGVSGSGAVHVGGQTINQGGISGDDLARVIERILAFASQVKDAEVADEGRQLVKELEAKPTKTVVQKLIGWTKTAAAGAKAGSALIQSGGELVQDLDGLANMFPS